MSAPPHKTVWPAGRTTTLTAELFAEDPNKAGVAACRDCHARAGTKPKLLDKMPVFEDIGTGNGHQIDEPTRVSSGVRYLSFSDRLSPGDTKAPKSTNCTTCHIAPKGKR
ncbi:MAG: hypothetical protein IPP63_13970 [Chloracidobacterium sp.]|nr:hypothetical protein [Chloracidobacterium sp.]